MLRRAGNEMQPKVMETKEGLVDYFLSVMTYSDRADVDKEMLEKYAEHGPVYLGVKNFHRIFSCHVLLNIALIMKRL